MAKLDLTDALVQLLCDPYLQVQDVCKVMNRSESSVYSWLQQGLKAETNSLGKRVVRLSELKKFLASKEQK